MQRARVRRHLCLPLLQVYSLHASMEAVVNYLEKVDPERAENAKQRYSCFDKCGRVVDFSFGTCTFRTCEH